MSDTPETDAAVIAAGGDWSPVLRETCRRLERERNAYYSKAMTNAGLILDARAERDEARDFLLQTQELCHEYLDAKIKVDRERDEARELLRILAGLVAYGLGQSGEEWSLEAIRQATNAIQNAKFLEEAK